MRNLFFILFCVCECSTLSAAVDRQAITQVRKQKEELLLKQQKILKEVDEIQQMLDRLALEQDKEKEKLNTHQEEIYRTLPLLARLERSNPLRLLADPTTGQYRVRGVILIRFLISSLKRKMQEVQENLNSIIVMSNNLEIKNSVSHHLLQDLEQQRVRLSALEGEKIEQWTKAERERINKEEDPNTLLDESRDTLSKDARKATKATALKGLPFRRLETPVRGKIFKDSALQNKYSPHSQGLFFEAQKNAQVHAPAKGKVVFKGPFRSQSEILIIDHGEKVHTILMGMHNITAEMGKVVYAGEKLGTMAGYGEGLPKLYLELRHKGKSMDPAPYFAITKLE